MQADGSLLEQFVSALVCLIFLAVFIGVALLVMLGGGPKRK
ncbi:MAG TPA: hypothetical protein VEX60_09205 [Pyrinomonadaceae bacterium]|nr:hypothetical protein [Pyrinomonadaceae bacterium]